MRLLITLLLFSVVLTKSAYSNPHSISSKLTIDILGQDDLFLNTNFYFEVTVPIEDTSSYFILPLPFTNNSKIQFSSKSIGIGNYSLFGFSNDGEGICLINNDKKKNKIELEFKNVLLPSKSATNIENGFIYYLDIAQEQNLPFKTEYSKRIIIDTLYIKSSNLLDSHPEFKLTKKGENKFEIILSEKDDSCYFVIPKPPKSTLKYFIILLVIAMVFGFRSSLGLIVGKTKSYWGLGVSLIALIYLGYIFFTEVLPTEFTTNVAFINMIGGFIGLAIGILSLSGYNLINIYAIEKQQEGG